MPHFETEYRLVAFWLSILHPQIVYHRRAMADARAQRLADQWGVSTEEAQEYAEHITGKGKYFATAVAFPYVNEARGVEHGVIVAVSTAESTRAENLHHESDSRGEVFQQCSWMYYDVWVYRDMNLLNFSGLHR